MALDLMKNFIFIAFLLAVFSLKAATFQNQYTTNAYPQSIAVGSYSTLTFSGFSTNSFDAVNGYQFPQANGHYAFSTAYGAYTNSLKTNELFFINQNTSLWQFGTNLNDGDGSQAHYFYFGSNPFPTNDPSQWGAGDENNALAAVPLSFDIGILATSNNPIVSIAPNAQTNTAMDASGGPPFVVYKYKDGQRLMSWYRDEGPTSANYRIDYFGYPKFPYWTNDNNAAHNFSPGTAIWRMNGGIDNGTLGAAPSDARGVLELGQVYGIVVLTNNAPDMSHCEDNGSILEYLVRRNLTNSTSVQSGTFMHPLKIDSLGHVQVGNIPEAEHGAYIPAERGWFVVREGTANVAQFILCKSPAYTGPVTNGWIMSDGYRLVAGQQGVQMSIPQLQNTNVQLSTATTFTWQFTSPFADTNYSVSAQGAAAALVSPSVGAKTTSSVVVSFTAFTGQLDLIAAHQ